MLRYESKWNYQAHGEESVAACTQSKDNRKQTKTTGLNKSIVEYKEVAMLFSSRASKYHLLQYNATFPISA
jgi:hypothetical protein